MIITSTIGLTKQASRWCDDIKPRDGDETNVRSRIVVQQYNVVKRDEVHQGTPHLKVLRMLLAPTKGVWNLGRQRGVLSFSDG